MLKTVSLVLAFVCLDVECVHASVVVRQESQLHISLDNVGDAESLSQELNKIQSPTSIKAIRIEGQQLQLNHLVLLERFVRLESLEVWSEVLSDEMIKSIPDLPFRTIALHSKQVTGATFDRLLTIKTLVSLNVARCELSHNGFRNIGRLTHLRYLAIGNTGLTDEDLVSLNELVLLKSLKMFDHYESPANDSLSAAGLVGLKPLTRLEEVELPGHLHGHEALLHMPPLPMLSGLWIENATTESLSRLKDFPSVVHLAIDNSKLTEGDMHLIAAMPYLKHLVLEKVSISPDASKLLAKCRGLREFYWRSAGITTEVMQALADLRLVELRLPGSDMTDAHLETFMRNYRDLEQLDISETKLTDHGIEALMASRCLTRLDIRHCRALTSKGLLPLGRIMTLELLIADVKGIDTVFEEITNQNPYLDIVTRLGL